MGELRIIMAVVDGSNVVMDDDKKGLSCRVTFVSSLLSFGGGFDSIAVVMLLLARVVVVVVVVGREEQRERGRPIVSDSIQEDCKALLQINGNNSTSQ